MVHEKKPLTYRSAIVGTEPTLSFEVPRDDDHLRPTSTAIMSRIYNTQRVATRPTWKIAHKHVDVGMFPVKGANPKSKLWKKELEKNRHSLALL